MGLQWLQLQKVSLSCNPAMQTIHSCMYKFPKENAKQGWSPENLSRIISLMDKQL